ncbi:MULTISPECIES: hypothetical protein [Microbaculum]|uniref:DUF1127 domain-containing protein n=1 Tax=Microbaculum marinisediminis TaxID=2931392 RepID=A0AAW5QX13_9HYPH|nr:hypothetical protein [Microbaculum sp. A6E488]MCT8972596.1 hypothetical protein [Microbaculum sp. A6E488]
MATTIFAPTHIAVEPRQRRSVLRRMFDHMVKAREAEARRLTARALWSYSDESLKNMGLTREELARWHSGATD